jgi:hypothetical protein
MIHAAATAVSKTTVAKRHKTTEKKGAKQDTMTLLRRELSGAAIAKMIPGC